VRVTAQLKLIALDDDDLAVISAQVQNARLQTADIIWRPREKRLVIGLDRLDWEQALTGQEEPRRMISALRFDRVLSCQSRNIDLATQEPMLELLGIEFSSTQAPSGNVVMLFDGGGALRLDVECLECELADLGAVESKAGSADESSEQPEMEA